MEPGSETENKEPVKIAAIKVHFKIKTFLFLPFTCFAATCCCQQTDRPDSTDLEEVQVTGYRAMNGTGYLNGRQGPIIYYGKKTALIEVDSIDANKAVNNTRQILGSVPGLLCSVCKKTLKPFMGNSYLKFCLSNLW